MPEKPRSRAELNSIDAPPQAPKWIRYLAYTVVTVAAISCLTCDLRCQISESKVC